MLINLHQDILSKEARIIQIISNTKCSHKRSQCQKCKDHEFKYKDITVNYVFENRSNVQELYITLIEKLEEKFEKF